MDSNCPNCGAPAIGRECAYCGTPFVEPTLEMAVGKVVDLSFEHEGMVYEFRIAVGGMSIDMGPDIETFRSWGGSSVYIRTSPDYEATFHGRVVPTVRDGIDCLVVVRQMT